MSELSIKIKIADREYPMRINAEEEERLRIAGKMVNEKLREYRQAFGIDDIQDLMAMVAFDSVVERKRVEDQSAEDTSTTLHKLQQFAHLIDSNL
jgi:cell division protein ZapA